MLITDYYRMLNEQMHRLHQFDGNDSMMHFYSILSYAQKIKAETILDYGCGSAEIGRHMPLKVHNYDPNVPEFAPDPPPCDLLICLDVLEHVEPWCIDAVVEHMQERAVLGMYLHIALAPDETKVLPDGSNPHSIIRSAEWWIRKFKPEEIICHRPNYSVTLIC